PAAHAAREDRHPPRGARRTAPEDRGTEHPGPGRRRVVDRDSRRKGCASERMSHVYCPECGFQNPEAANYCSKCGALLHSQESVETTQTFSAEEREELLETLGDIGVSGPALVVRSGGGRPFGEADLERLEKILRLQRDEFLPLRVMREELAAGAGKERRRRRTTARGEQEEGLDLDGLCERAGIEPARARELEEFGL